MKNSTKATRIKEFLRKKLLEKLLEDIETRERIAQNQQIIDLIEFADYLQRSHLRSYEKLEIEKLLLWFSRKFASPAPNLVKWEVMKRFGSQNVWVETGTYLGETTKILGAHANKVYTVEPSLELMNLAKSNCIDLNNIEFYNGISENLLEKIISTLSDSEVKDISFWLDGHFSFGNTFLGPSISPIKQELAIISNNLNKFESISIFVDDVRGFPTNSKQEFTDYPELNWLVEWAKKNGMYWTIEHDIFVIRDMKFDYDM